MPKSSFVPRIGFSHCANMALPQEIYEAVKARFLVYESALAGSVILDVGDIAEEAMPELQSVLGVDPKLLGGGLVLLWPQTPPALQSFIVLYRDETLSLLDCPLGFLCQAEDGDHAEEQCRDANPDCEIVWVLASREDDDIHSALSRAMNDYYGSALTA